MLFIFSEALARKDLSRKAHPLDCDPLDTTGVGYGGPLSADFGAIEGALRATLGRSRGTPARPPSPPPRGLPPLSARCLPGSAARPTFSPASIKLPLGPLAGGSCARARGPPTIYTPTCVMCASQRSAPLLGPTGRGKASTDPANEKQRPGIGVSLRSRLLSLLRP